MHWRRGSQSGVGWGFYLSTLQQGYIHILGPHVSFGRVQTSRGSVLVETPIRGPHVVYTSLLTSEGG